MKLESSDQYLRFPERAVSRDPQQTQSLQTAQAAVQKPASGSCFDTDEIMESGSKPQEAERGAWSHASKCCWTNPISSLTGVLRMTFTVLTAADQNNTYLFMHTSRNHMWATEVYIPGKKQTDVTPASWHWVSGQCAIIWESQGVTEVCSFHIICRIVWEEWAQKDKTLTGEYQIASFVTQTFFSCWHRINLDRTI